MEAKLKTLSAQEVDLKSKMAKVQQLIAVKQDKWFGEKTNLFKETRRQLETIFHEDIGVNWHKGTEAKLIPLLKKHKGAYEAYQRVQEFFELVYITFKDVEDSKDPDVQGDYWQQFCTLKALEPLGDLAKAFIGADDYCGKKKWTKSVSFQATRNLVTTTKVTRTHHVRTVTTRSSSSSSSSSTRSHSSSSSSSSSSSKKVASK